VGSIQGNKSRTLLSNKKGKILQINISPGIYVITRFRNGTASFSAPDCCAVLVSLKLVEEDIVSYPQI
jgi:hypothetical protein